MTSEQKEETLNPFIPDLSQSLSPSLPQPLTLPHTLPHALPLPPSRPPSLPLPDSLPHPPTGQVNTPVLTGQTPVHAPALTVSTPVQSVICGPGTFLGNQLLKGKTVWNVDAKSVFLDQYGITQHTLFSNNNNNNDDSDANKNDRNGNKNDDKNDKDSFNFNKKNQSQTHTSFIIPTQPIILCCIPSSCLLACVGATNQKIDKEVELFFEVRIVNIFVDNFPDYVNFFHTPHVFCLYCIHLLVLFFPPIYVFFSLLVCPFIFNVAFRYLLRISK